MPSPVMTVGQWESIRRELVWIRRAGIQKKFLARDYDPGDQIVAWRLLRGSAVFCWSGKKLRIRAGQWIFPGPLPARRTFTADVEVVSIRFRICWPGGGPLFNQDRRLVAAGDQAAVLDRVGFDLVDYVQEKMSPDGIYLPQTEADLERYLVMRGYFERWFQAYVEFMTGRGLLPTAGMPVDERILEALGIMERGLQSGIIPREGELAQKVGLSLSHFKRLFSGHVRKTPKAWMDDRRYEMACDRLRGAGRLVKQTGYELGFRSPNHFSSWFQKKGGISPGGFRKRNP